MFDIKQYFKTSSLTIENLYEHSEKIKEICEHISKVSKDGKKVLVAGNGGSCSDAEHFVGMQCTYKKEIEKQFQHYH